MLIDGPSPLTQLCLASRFACCSPTLPIQRTGSRLNARHPFPAEAPTRIGHHAHRQGKEINAKSRFIDRRPRVADL